MEVLLTIVLLAALLSAMMVKAEAERRFAAKGDGVVRSMFKGWVLGALAAFLILAVFFGLGSTISNLML